MKRKLLPILIAVLLILIIGGGAAGRVLYDKYSYSKEQADMDEYYGVAGEESAIILQDEAVEEKALVREGICYFDLDTVHKYMNEVFYADMDENLLIYTDAVESIMTTMGDSTYTTAEGIQDMGITISFVENDTVYVAADYVKLFTNYSYDVYDRHVQVYTEWGTKDVADINKDTAVRVRGGVKSAVLRDLSKGETVEILEEMDNWSKVKTQDSIIGYVENKRLTDIRTEDETAVNDYEAPEYTTLPLGTKVNLGFHSIGGTGGNVTLDSMVSESPGINVIAPTWFSMNDNEGGIRSFGTADYVSKAHSYGLKVWGVVDNFNYENETGTDIDVLAVLSSTSKRQKLVSATVSAAKNLGLDGINVDFEGLSSECGIHYVQFLRELSVQCRAEGLVLSIDDYVPFNFNDFYRLDIQGEIADYVIIMGYDEHWHGSGDPGSVASIDYVSNGLDRTLNEVPAEKVINALPLYTILWRTEGSTVTDEYVTMNNVADLLKRVGVEAEWDETTNQNYAEWTVGNAKYQIWIEDEKSISVKLNVMRTKEIGGVATWRLGYGTSGVWELLKLYISM
jgi:spore germination protein YaaH